MDLQTFCGESIWDANLTWNTAHPDLTDCFENTALIWTPCGFLLLIAPFYYFCYLRHVTLPPGDDVRRSKSKLYFSKLAFTSLLMMIHTASLIYNSCNYLSQTTGTQPVLVVSPALQIFTFTISAFLLDVEWRKRLVTSGVHFLFYLLFLISSILLSASYISRALKISALDLPRIPELVMTSLHSSTIFIQFFTVCFADKANASLPTRTEHKEHCPESRASFLSRITFWWMNRLILTGYKKTLTEDDLWQLSPVDATDANAAALQKNWTEEVARCNRHNAMKLINTRRQHSLGDETSPLLPEVSVVGGTSDPKPKKAGLFKTIMKTFWKGLLLSHFCQLLCDLLIVVGPILQSLLISYIELSAFDSSSVWKGYLYAVLFFINSVVFTSLSQQVYFIGMRIGMRVSSSVNALIFKKALTMNSGNHNEYATGEIVNLMSVDTQRLQNAFPYLWIVWSAILQITLSLYFLWRLLGYSVFAGMATMLLFIPLNAVAVTYETKFENFQMKKKDERLKLLNEIFNGIKVIKFYAWELAFKERVNVIRDLELSSLRKLCYLNTFITFIWTCAPFTIMFVSFATYAATGGVLDANTAFTALSFFNILSFCMIDLPTDIAYFVMAGVSINRIGKYLQCQDLPRDIVTRFASRDAISIEKGTFAWGTDPSDEPILKNINLKVDKNTLIAVVGQVGSGKSSLLSAILGDMEKVEGQINVDGTVAYVSQQAWIQNATLRDNILFGQPYDPDKYWNIIEVCALKQDLDMFPAGDMTEIGEKGINLSGGQKQRVSLARSLYQDCNIYLLDDPLSAVDSHVGKHIFNFAIGPSGFLKDKTRILVTHGISWLPVCDVVVVMSEKGEIAECGHYDDLLGQNKYFASFIRDFHLQHKDKEDDEESDNADKPTSSDDGDDEVICEINPTHFNHSLNKRSPRRSGSTSSAPRQSLTSQSSLLRKRTRHTGSESESEEPAVKDYKDVLITEEQRETGSVKLSVYMSYIRSLGLLMAIAFLFSNIVYQAFFLTSNVWLSMWTNDPVIRNDSIFANSSIMEKTQLKYVAGYGAFGICQAVSLFLATFIAAEMNVRSSRSQHSSLLSNILKSPISFFDTTPIGRILNRFSKDIEIIDNEIINILQSWLFGVLNVISTAIVIGYTTPLFLLVIVPLLIVYHFIQRYYISTTRQLKRLESTTRSPIYAHFGETIVGASVIRAYAKQDEFVRRSLDLIDRNMAIHFAKISAERWLGFNLELLGGITILSTALFVVIGRHDLSPSIVGLSISYALQITTSFAWLVGKSTELETDIVSVERIKEYTETPTEADWESHEVHPPLNWPHHGGIRFVDYGLRYRPGLDLVLKNVTLEIRPGEKVGVVGRTGAGKSSLTLALFRLIEPAKGDILIDDVDITKLGLHKLRSNLTILPQDPVLFSGTLRMNLDPLSHHSDHQLWDAIHLAHLKNYVDGLPEKLDYECGESGGNMSVGQRQLVCLGRSLLHKTSILILDEATAAVDLETDRVIQKTIRTEFSECTIVTIAHRINTILHCDRILVMEAGRIVEFDSPRVLLADTTSAFYGLANDAGLINPQNTANNI